MTSHQEFQLPDEDMENTYPKVNPHDQTDLLRYFRSTAVEISNFREESQNLRMQLFWGKVLLAVLLFLIGGGLSWLVWNFNQLQRLSSTEAQNSANSTEEVATLKQQIEEVRADVSADIQAQLREQQAEIEEVKLQLTSVQRELESSQVRQPSSPEFTDLTGSENFPNVLYSEHRATFEN